MRESNLLIGCQPSENHTKRSNCIDFGFEKIMDLTMDVDKFHLANLVGEVMEEVVIMDFAMDIDKLNLANLVGKVMDRIKEHQTSPKNHISRQKLQNLPNLTPKPYWTFYQTFMPLYHSLKSVRPCLFYESVENDPVRIRTPLI